MALPLGAAAAASQLAVYALSIVSFITATYKRVRDAPEQYREYEIQLKLLIDIVGSVQKVPALQTPEVEWHLRNTAAEVQALQSLLCCRAVSSNTSFLLRCSLWETVQGSEQRRISAHLERLYKKNTALQLYISTINTIQLSSVNRTAEKIMVNTTPNPNNEITMIGEVDEIERIEDRTGPGLEIAVLDSSQSSIAPQPQFRMLQTNPETSANSREYFRTYPQSSGRGRLHENNEPSANARNFAEWRSTGCKNFYGEVKIHGIHRVTAGNEYHSHGAIPTIEHPPQFGHFYKEFIVSTNGTTSGENTFHGGDAGAGGVTGGHYFGGFDFDGTTAVHLGNFETVELKRKQGFHTNDLVAPH